MKTPQPRIGSYYGMSIQSQKFEDGTWLEGEEFCYPSGGMLRLAYAECEDEVYRVCQCGIPDTFFSIPAQVKIKGRSVNGFLSIKHFEFSGGSLVFKECKG